MPEINKKRIAGTRTRQASHWQNVQITKRAAMRGALFISNVFSVE